MPSLDPGSFVVACTDYDGVEVGENRLREGGYLKCRQGDQIVVKHGASKGHSRNRFNDYFFGALRESEVEVAWGSHSSKKKTAPPPIPSPPAP